MANYADYTYNAPNLLQRFSHRKRFKKSIELIPPLENVKLLDFGCGDGLFLNRLKTTLGEQCFLMGYDPLMPPIQDNKVEITSDWEKVVKEKPFHCVTCFEVLEHFDEYMQKEILEKIASVLINGGSLIISLPIEMGLPSVVKNCYRKFTAPPQDRHLYSAKNIMAACFKKDLSKYRQGADYLSHVGFYFTDLEKILLEKFILIDKTYAPFPLLGRQFNSQVFYRMKKSK